MITVDFVDTEAGLRALRSEWNMLADQLDPPSPFNGWEWAHSWWEHLGPAVRAGSACRLEIVTMREAGRLIGLAPFYRRRLRPRWAGLSFLLPIGWEPGRGWSVSEQLEFLFPQDQRARLVSALCAWLEHQRWSVAVLPGLHEEDLLSPWTVSHTVARGEETPYLYRALTSPWDAFERDLNKSLRDNVRYYPRLVRRDGHKLQFEIASTREDVLAALTTLMTMHRARSRAPMRVRHRDYFAEPTRRSFFRCVAPTLAARGQLRIGVLWLDDTPVAAQMWLENRGVMFLYYSGYEPTWSRYSVALIATVEAVKDAIDRGLHQIEFLAGRGQFKERWEPSRRVRFNVTIAAHPTLLRPLFALAGVRRVIRRFS